MPRWYRDVLSICLCTNTRDKHNLPKFLSDSANHLCSIRLCAFRLIYFDSKMGFAFCTCANGRDNFHVAMISQLFHYSVFSFICNRWSNWLIEVLFIFSHKTSPHNVAKGHQREACHPMRTNTRLLSKELCISLFSWTGEAVILILFTTTVCMVH
jgi:hypothetical protein